MLDLIMTCISNTFLNGGTLAKNIVLDTLIGIDIPIGYGFSIEITAADDIADNDIVNNYIFDKIMYYGGAIGFRLKFAVIGLPVACVLHLGSITGLTAIVYSIEPLQEDCYQRVVHLLYALVADFEVEVTIINSSDIEEWFNMVYYTGALINGKYTRFRGLSLEEYVNYTQNT